VHLSDEPVAATRDRGDIAVVVRLLAQDLPQDKHRLREVRFLDSRVPPYQAHQVVFFDDAGSMLDEGEQHIVGLRRELHGLAIAHQPAPGRIETERPEVEECGWGRIRSHLTVFENI
jgi:hypothetical protein